MLTGFEDIDLDAEEEVVREVFTILHQHPNMFVLSKDIEEELNISGAKVRSSVKQLRRRLVFIASTSKGYKLSTNPVEIHKTIKHMKERCSSMLRTVQALEGRAISFFKDSYTNISEYDAESDNSLYEIAEQMLKEDFD